MSLCLWLWLRLLRLLLPLPLPLPLWLLLWLGVRDLYKLYSNRHRLAEGHCRKFGSSGSWRAFRQPEAIAGHQSQPGFGL